MATSKIASDGRPVNVSELPAPGSLMAQLDANNSTSGYKPLWQAPTHRDEERYNMSHKNRGKLVIFNHKTFVKPHLKERRGTESDKNMMRKVFHKMNFEVEIWDDLDAADVIGKLHSETFKGSFYKDSDCLVVAVMTHGEENGLIWANDISYQVETLWDEFMANKCPALAGKPKIFIIQACRGNVASEAIHVEKPTVQKDGIKIQRNTMRYSIPLEADLLIAYSTFPGKSAHRDIEDGTWFIQELCNELEETGNSDDFLSILTKVNRRVALNYEFGTSKQMPMIQSTLTRKIFFGETQKIISDNFDHTSSQKLDKILEMLQDFKFEPRRTMNKPRSSTEWDGIKPKNESFEINQTDDQIVKIASALKLLLCDKKQVLQASVREDGRTILNLVSVWGSLAHDQRCFVYGRLVNFLKTYGNDWEYLKMVTLPALGAERRRRFSSPSMSLPVTDGRRSIDRRIPKRMGK